MDGSEKLRRSLGNVYWAAGRVQRQGHPPHLLLLQLGSLWWERNSRLLCHLAPPCTQLEQFFLGLAVVIQLRSPGWDCVRCWRGEACIWKASWAKMLLGNGSSLSWEGIRVALLEQQSTLYFLPEILHVRGDAHICTHTDYWVRCPSKCQTLKGRKGRSYWMSHHCWRYWMKGWLQIPPCEASLFLLLLTQMSEAGT